MKEGWQIKAFSEISHSIDDGDWIEKKDQSETGIRLIQTGNIGVGQYRDKAEKAKFISEDTFKRLKCTEIVCGDILVSRLPDPVGRACILPSLPYKCITAVDCSIIKLKDNVIHPSWFVFYTQSQEYFAKVRKGCSGTTRDRISRKKLEVITIPVPPLSEQQRIVALLDTEFAKIDALKANAEKNLQNAKDLFQATLKKELEPKNGWNEKKIGELFETGSGGTPLKMHKEYYEGGNIPWLRSGEVCKKYITKTELFITKLGLDNSSAKYFPSNTIVVAMYGATAGQVGILKIQTTTNQAVCGIFPNELYIPEFVYYSIQSKQENLVSQATGNAQPNISQIKIKNLSILR